MAPVRRPGMLRCTKTSRRSSTPQRSGRGARGGSIARPGFSFRPRLPGGVEAGEVFRAELAHLAGDQGQRVADGEHRRGAARGARPRAPARPANPIQARLPPALPSVLSERAVTAISGVASRESKVASGPPLPSHPLWESIRTTSQDCTRPRSPWTASAGWRKWRECPSRRRWPPSFLPTEPRLAHPGDNQTAPAPVDQVDRMAKRRSSRTAIARIAPLSCKRISRASRSCSKADSLAPLGELPSSSVRHPDGRSCWQGWSRPIVASMAISSNADIRSARDCARPGPEICYGHGPAPAQSILENLPSGAAPVAIPVASTPSLWGMVLRTCLAGRLHGRTIAPLAALPGTPDPTLRLVAIMGAFEIPYQRQQIVGGGRACGAAALAMVYRSLGVDCRQEDIWIVSRRRSGRTSASAGPIGWPRTPCGTASRRPFSRLLRRSTCCNGWPERDAGCLEPSA